MSKLERYPTRHWYAVLKAEDLGCAEGLETLNSKAESSYV